MDKEKKRLILKKQREKLIALLEEVYKNAFNELTNIGIEEGSIAKLSQAFLLSREAALSQLKKEIENAQRHMSHKELQAIKQKQALTKEVEEKRRKLPIELKIS